VLTQVPMSPDAQRSHGQNIPRGRRDVQSPPTARTRDARHLAPDERGKRGMDRALQVA
jgi:hypothetical protein